MQRGGGDADPGCMERMSWSSDAELGAAEQNCHKDNLHEKDWAARSRSPRREWPKGRWDRQLGAVSSHRALALAAAETALALAGWTPDEVAQWQWDVRDMDCEAPSDAGGAMTEERQPNQWRYEQIPDEQEDEWPWGNWVEINTGGDMERCFVKAGAEMWTDWRGHQWYKVAQHGQHASEWHDCGPHEVGPRVTSTPHLVGQRVTSTPVVGQPVFIS